MRTIKSNGWIAALALVAAGLYGCSGEQTPQPQQQQQAPTVQETAPPASTPATPEAPADQQAPAAGSQEGVSQELIAQGQQVFTTTTCFTCHGPTGTGTALAPNLTAGEWLNTEEGTLEQIQQVVRNGVAQPKQFPAPMPPMGGAQLTDQQIEAVSAYVYSISRSKT
ncbi:MAG TPA: c-type cytochrome [Longimicrobiales bacterium]|nr:c-type cytochrome [Longimicrobiales bacterium]